MLALIRSRLNYFIHFSPPGNIVSCWSLSPLFLIAIRLLIWNMDTVGQLSTASLQLHLGNCNYLVQLGEKLHKGLRYSSMSNLSIAVLAVLFVLLYWICESTKSRFTLYRNMLAKANIFPDTFSILFIPNLKICLRGHFTNLGQSLFNNRLQIFSESGFKTTKGMKDQTKRLKNNIIFRLHTLI